MNSILRVLFRAPESASTPSFARCFSVYLAAQAKGDHARLREKDPEAYKRLLDREKAYLTRYRSEDPVAYRRRLDSQARAFQKWLQKPAKYAKVLENHRLAHAARRGKERTRFLASMTNWSHRHAWFGQDLPWKSHQPVSYNERIEHYCEGCKWTVKGGRKLWWKQIQSSPTADTDNWLCNACYVPETNCREAMPRGYEDVTTFKELVKRRDELGHGA